MRSEIELNTREGGRLGTSRAEDCEESLASNYSSAPLPSNSNSPDGCPIIVSSQLSHRTKKEKRGGCA